MAVQEILNYKSNGCEAELRVSVATIRHGIRRGILIVGAKSTNPDPIANALEELNYSNALAVTEGQVRLFEGTDEGERNLVSERPVAELSLEEWLDLPAPFGAQWSRLVYKLNPAWRAGGDSSEEDGEGEAEGGAEEAG